MASKDHTPLWLDPGLGSLIHEIKDEHKVFVTTDLSREYEELAAQLYQSAVTSSMQSKRKTLAEFQVK